MFGKKSSSNSFLGNVGTEDKLFPDLRKPPSFMPTVHDPERKAKRQAILDKLSGLHTEYDLVQDSLIMHQTQNTKTTSRKISNEIKQRIENLEAHLQKLQDIIKQMAKKYRIHAEDNNYQRIISILIQRFSAEKAHSLHATLMPGYQIIEPTIKKLSIQEKQLLAKKMLELSALSAADEKVIEQKKQELREQFNGIFTTYTVEILSFNNNTTVKLQHKFFDFSFIARTNLFSREEFANRFSSMDARLALFNAYHTDKKNADIFKLITEQFYFSKVSIKEEHASASKNESEIDLSAFLTDDDLLFLEFSEYVPVKNLAEEYAHLHQESDNEHIVRQAFHDFTRLNKLFYKMLSQQICFTDLKPQNIFRHKQAETLFKIGDIKSLLQLPEAINGKIILPRAEFTNAYTDHRLTPRDFKPELSLKIGIVASLYHCLTNQPPEVIYTDEDKLQTLGFYWDHPILQQELYKPTGKEEAETIAQFLNRHYQSDDVSIKTFLTELAMYNIHLNAPKDSRAELSEEKSAPLFSN